MKHGSGVTRGALSDPLERQRRTLSGVGVRIAEREAAEGDAAGAGKIHRFCATLTKQYGRLKRSSIPTSACGSRPAPG